MTQKRVRGPYTFSGLTRDMVYGPKSLGPQSMYMYRVAGWGQLRALDLTTRTISHLTGLVNHFVVRISTCCTGGGPPFTDMAILCRHPWSKRLTHKEIAASMCRFGTGRVNGRDT